MDREVCPLSERFLDLVVAHPARFVDAPYSPIMRRQQTGHCAKFTSVRPFFGLFLVDVKDALSRIKIPFVIWMPFLVHAPTERGDRNPQPLGSCTPQAPGCVESVKHLKIIDGLAWAHFTLRVWSGDRPTDLLACRSSWLCDFACAPSVGPIASDFVPRGALTHFQLFITFATIRDQGRQPPSVLNLSGFPLAYGRS